MANTIITPDIIAAEALSHLENDLVLGNLVHTDYSKEFAKVGDTISIRRPVMFEGQEDNLDITAVREDVVEGKETIVMNKTFTIPWEFNSLELTLEVEEYSQRYIRPAIIKMRDKVELELSRLYDDLYWYTGVPGTLPSTFKELGRAGTILTNAGVPMDSRVAVHDPDVALELADGLKSVYVQSKAKSAFEEASIGRYARFDNYESVHVMKHVVGAHGGTPLVDGAAQNVTYVTAKDTWTQTLITDGWTNSITGILKAGDIFTIAGVNSVNPISKQDSGALQTFVVKADADSGATTGPATLTIAPPIITSGAYQTVTAAPADNGVITVKTGTAGASYPQSMCFHKNTFALVTRPLVVPDGTTWSRTMTGNKMSISVIKDFDFNTRREMIRLDMLFGVKTIYPQLGARLTG